MLALPKSFRLIPTSQTMYLIRRLLLIQLLFIERLQDPSAQQNLNCFKACYYPSADPLMMITLLQNQWSSFNNR